MACLSSHINCEPKPGTSPFRLHGQVFEIQTIVGCSDQSKETPFGAFLKGGKCASDKSSYNKRTTSTMNLHAHLPFLTLRHENASDHRSLASGKSLRGSIEIPRMKSMSGVAKSSDRVGWLHQTQISIHISTVDQHCWTAYMFEDTYYKKGKEAAKLAVSLRDASDNCLDALIGAGSVGSRNPDTTLYQDHLEYFLLWLEARIKKADLAWETVVEELERNVQE